jgi:predicted translin family RNA/ssDNA-binding protein
MFRKSTTQSSIFEVNNYFPDALPEHDWCFTFRERVLPLIDEEKFRHLYCESDGRPNASIRTMVSLLIFMGLEQYSWRGTEFQFARRLDWLIATNTPFGQAQIDHTTLFKFYQRLEADDTARELFVELTDAFIKACGTSVKKQRTDSFYIHGWLKILSRYGLFKETIRKFLQALRKQQPDVYINIKQQMSQDYLEQEFDLTEKDKDLAHRKISLMAQDLYQLKTAFEHHNQVKHYETFKILVKIFEQQCEIKETKDKDPEIIIKEKPDGDTICTPHNIKARYVRKGKQRVTGDKGFVTETCDPDNKTQFITDIEATESTEPDSKQQPQIQERLIENEFKPDQQYEDAGFINGQTILDSHEKDIELEGPTAGRSQSFEAYEDNQRPLDAGDFNTTLDEQTGQLTVNECPNHQPAKDQQRSEKTGKINVHYDPDVCRACPDVQRCPVKIGKRVATYTVDEAEYVGAVRHHQYMSNREYRKECAIRAGVEATVSELTRAHGLRKSRHRDRSRTKLQLIFGALACNVKRFIRHGEQYAYLEPKPA